MAEDQPASQLDNNLVTQLLTLVKTLQAEVAALKSGATSGSGSQPPLASLSQTDSAVSGKDPLVKWLRSEEGEDSEEQPLSSDEEDDHVFTLSEPGTSFMETAFNTGKTPCKYGPVFALYLYRIEFNRVNTVQKRVRIYTAFFLCKSKLNATSRRNKWQSWACPTVDGQPSILRNIEE